MSVTDLTQIELIPFSEKQYVKTMWMDGTNPSINAERLLKIETGLYDLYRYLCGGDGSGSYYRNLNRITTSINTLITELTAEAKTRGDADASLTNILNSEIHRAQTAEQDLLLEMGKDTDESNYKARLSDGKMVSTIHSRIQLILEELTEEINSTNTKLANEITRATGAEAANKNSIDSERQSRLAQDAILANSITNEASRASLAEEEITRNLDNLTTLVGATTDTASSPTVFGAIAKTKTETLRSIGNEVSRATTAEGELSSTISSNVSRIDDKLVTLENALSAEQSRATSKEVEIEAALVQAIADLTALINQLSATVDAGFIDINNRADTLEESLGIMFTNTTNSINDLDSRITESNQELNNKIESLRGDSSTSVGELNEKVNSLTLSDLNSSDEEVILDGGSISELI